MAKLPSTIYNEILRRQKELYKSGARNGTVSLEDAYTIFAAAGYKQSTANKWMLNWAVSRVLCFEKEKDAYYCIRLGQFLDKTSSECLDNGKVWLPVKEVKIKIKDDYWGNPTAKFDSLEKSQGMIL